MKLSHQDYETVTVLTLSGDFSHDDVEPFIRAVGDRRRIGVKHVLIRCDNLEFIDSAGLECWLRLQEDLGVEGGQLRLIEPEETIQKILEITRLDLAFESHASVEAAVRSLR